MPTSLSPVVRAGTFMRGACSAESPSGRVEVTTRRDLGAETVRRVTQFDLLWMGSPVIDSHPLLVQENP